MMSDIQKAHDQFTFAIENLAACFRNESEKPEFAENMQIKGRLNNGELQFRKALTLPHPHNACMVRNYGIVVKFVYEDQLVIGSKDVEPNEYYD